MYTQCMCRRHFELKEVTENDSHMLSADCSVNTLIDRKPSISDIFKIHVKRMSKILVILSKINIFRLTDKFLPHPLTSTLINLKTIERLRMFLYRLFMFESSPTQDMVEVLFRSISLEISGVYQTNKGHLRWD